MGVWNSLKARLAANNLKVAPTIAITPLGAFLGIDDPDGVSPDRLGGEYDRGSG
jgi:hypothetical protein